MSIPGTSEKCCCFSICLFVSLQTSTLLPSWRRWKTPWVRLSNAPSLPSCNALLPIGHPQHFYYCQKQPQQNQPLIHRIVSFYLTSLGATYFSLNFAKKNCKRRSSFQPEPAHFSSADDTDQQWPEQKNATIITSLMSKGGATVLILDQRHQNDHNSNIPISKTKQIAIPMQIKKVPWQQCQWRKKSKELRHCFEWGVVVFVRAGLMWTTNTTPPLCLSNNGPGADSTRKDEWPLRLHQLNDLKVEKKGIAFLALLWRPILSQTYLILLIPFGSHFLVLGLFGYLWFCSVLFSSFGFFLVLFYCFWFYLALFGSFTFFMFLFLVPFGSFDSFWFFLFLMVLFCSVWFFSSSFSLGFFLVYDAVSVVVECWVAFGSDFQNGSRVLKRVL